MSEELKTIVVDILDRVKKIETILESSEKSATAGRIDEEVEPIKRFVAEACTVTNTRDRDVTTDLLFDAYQQWCGVRSVDPCHRTTFGKAIRRTFPGIQVKSKTTKCVIDRYYIGIGVNRFWRGGGWESIGREDLS